MERGKQAQRRTELMSSVTLMNIINYDFNNVFTVVLLKINNYNLLKEEKDMRKSMFNVCWKSF